MTLNLPFSLQFCLISYYIPRSGFFFNKLGAIKACLRGYDHLYILVSYALDRCLFVHVVGRTGRAN